MRKNKPRCSELDFRVVLAKKARQRFYSPECCNFLKKQAENYAHKNDKEELEE